MDAVIAEKIFRFYRAGLLKGQTQDLKRSPDFQMLLSLVVRERIPLRERARFRRIWNASGRGLSATRDNQLEKAAQIFAEGEYELAGCPQLSECRLLGISILESAYAYLEYRQGRFVEARKRTHAALDADLMLESKAMYGVLELHRIQAVHNLMRIDLKAGDYLHAFSLAGQALAYLEGHLPALTVHRGWSTKLLEQTPRILRRKMVAQVAEEVALALLTKFDKRNWTTLCDEIEPWLNSESVGFHPRARLWFEVKHALAFGDAIHYLDLLSRFLAGGRDDIAILWYSCIVDFLDFCATLDSPIARFASAAILKDSSKWPAVPKTIRFCLERFGGGLADLKEPASSTSVGGFGGPSVSAQTRRQTLAFPRIPQ
jgi:tetratricopeptide (TPR) repeat protein